MQLTKNFKLSEFACNDGTPVPSCLFDNVAELARNLQVLRDEVKAPIVINSGYRTPEHNASVGGKPHSMHLTAMAADIYVMGLNPVQVKSTIETLIASGKMAQGGIGLYKTFVHYDIFYDGKHARRW
jgi:uncharacterized protein YcbK (DUF882 family)